MCGPAWTLILLSVLPCIIGMTGGSLLEPLVELGSCGLLLRPAFNHDSPNLCVPNRWDYRRKQQHSAGGTLLKREIYGVATRK
jgi:hypothetical protein